MICKYYLKLGISILFIVLNTSLFSQTQKNNWKKITPSDLNTSKIRSEFVVPNRGLLYHLDLKSLKQQLNSVNASSSIVKKRSVKIKFPNLKGGLESFTVNEASVFQEELQLKYPEIRSYTGTNGKNTIRFSISTQKGLSLTYTSGENIGFIEKKSGDDYIVYNRTEGNKIVGEFNCLTVDEIQLVIKNSLFANKEANDLKLRTYLLALSVTAEYTEYHYDGPVGPGEEAAAKAAALAGMNATITRINGIFNRDFGVELKLINNVEDIIYTNPDTDPYSDYTSYEEWGTELQANLTNTIGSSSYDIGHLFGHNGGGGNAGCIGCVCEAGLKGSGYTSPVNGVPEGDFFDLDYVAHEIGHQFGANHTWTSDESGPNSEGTGANLEPGSGSTIMGYAGITTSNVESKGDDYFHFKSIEQVTTFIKNTSCGQLTDLSQNIPVSNAGSDFVIPHSTAFILEGEGNSSGTTSYVWEQNDLGGTGGIETSDPSPTNATGPMFRSLRPTNSPNRYMPNYQAVLNGNLSTTWESVSSVERDLNFKLTVRDNISGGGQNAISSMTVSVDGESGPFKLTSQNEEGIIWNRGGSETITWDVANTNESPVNTSHVDILISTDRGVSYTPLISNTPNDGSQEVAVPLIAAPYCRIMIKASNNIYYALNSHEFSIDYLVEITCNSYSDSPTIAITDNSSSFDETTITIPENVTISDVNISVDIEHTWLGDLLITLLSPAGTELKLIDRDCSSFENLEVTFDDSGTTKICNSPTTGLILPEESLAVLKGELSTGQWTIRINDNEAQDTGILSNWSVQICSTKLTELLTLEFLNIFPNPSSGSINISMYSESDEPIEVSIIDMAGKHIKSENFSPRSGLLNTLFDYGSLAQGIYVLKIVQGANTTAKKIIVN